MNELLAPSEAQGGIKAADYTFDACPECAGPIILQANGDTVEEVCESCGPIALLFQENPKEKNPDPVDPKDAGQAPMPQGLVELMFFDNSEKPKAKKNVHRPDN